MRTMAALSTAGLILVLSHNAILPADALTALVHISIRKMQTQMTIDGTLQTRTRTK